MNVKKIIRGIVLPALFFAAPFTVAAQGSSIPTARVNGGFDFGFQAGVGVNFTIGDTHTFMEFGFVNVLTTGPTTSWVPVRLGVRL